MKKANKLLMIGVVLAFVLAACGDDGGSGTTAADDGSATTAAAGEFADLGGETVTIGVENAYLPFNFIPVGETDGQGWDYDAWAYICEQLNCVPEFVESAWPAVIDQVAAGELDVAADGISITDERKEIVDYSDPYMVVEQKFIVQLDDDRFDSAQALIDDPEAIVATQVGTTNFELAATLVGEDRIQAFDQFGLAIQALINGDVDAVIIDDAAGLGYIGENKESIKTIPDALQSDPLGFIFPKGSELVAAVNPVIQEMKDNGTMEDLGVKFFGPDFTVTYDDIATPTTAAG
jgi:polar amino acid transport system substrate-binding protein